MKDNKMNLEERINKCREQDIPESTIQFVVNNLDLFEMLSDDNFESAIMKENDEK